MTNRSMTNRSMTSLTRPPKGDVRHLAARLGELPLFESASRADLAEIAATGVLLTVPADWSLIWERTPADKAYVVLSGQLDIRRAGVHVFRLSAGDVVGETAILERRLRTATVVAATQLEVLHFTAEAVQRLYAEVPAFCQALDVATLRHAAA
jgi:CRP/FNR family cyclic AMP-dependent transcriptional regulator